MSSSVNFNEVWKGLVSKSTTAEERGQFYLSLTGLLKSVAGGTTGGEVQECLSRHNRALVKAILGDINSDSCGHSALQALGYFIHNPECAKKFPIEQIIATVTGLCEVIGRETTSKTVCTRALWCLANQNFPSSQLMDHAATIVSTVTEMLLSQQQTTPTVDTEALNLLMRLDIQCRQEFHRLTPLWYKAVATRLLFSKSAKYTNV